MYFRNLDELRALQPMENKTSNKENLKEYLIQSCNCNFVEFVDLFMEKY